MSESICDNRDCAGKRGIAGGGDGGGEVSLETCETLRDRYPFQRQRIERAQFSVSDGGAQNLGMMH